MLGALLLASAAAALPQAQSPADEADLRCMAVLSLAIAQMPDAQKPGVVAGVLYFMGRIDARASGLDLEAGLRRVSAELTQDLIRSEGQRCGAIMTERGQHLQRVGAAMQGR